MRPKIKVSVSVSTSKFWSRPSLVNTLIHILIILIIFIRFIIFIILIPFIIITVLNLHLSGDRL